MFLNSDEVNKVIVSIRRRSKNLRVSVQDVLVSVAGHILNHGDVTQFRDLLQAIVGMDVRAVTLWGETYGFVTVKGKGQQRKVRLNKKARNAAIEEYGENAGEAYVKYLEANAPDWWEAVEAEKAAKLIDPAQSITNLAARIAKGENDTIFTVAGMRDALDALCTAMNEADYAEESVSGFDIEVKGEDILPETREAFDPYQLQAVGS